MKSLFTFLAVLCFGLSSHAVIMGTDHGNAGDTVALEFLRTARDLMHRLDLLVVADKPVFDTMKLRAVVASTEVVSEERVYLDGFEKDAINFPERRLIQVSRVRWQELRAPAMTRARLKLVLHEFLWVTGQDDRDGGRSEELLNLLDVPNYSPEVWSDPVTSAAVMVECGGQVDAGPFVMLHVTVNALGYAEQASVTFEVDRNKFGYRFERDDMPQFYALDDVASSRAIVGVSALVNRLYPVSLRYVGANFADMDLKTELSGGTALSSGNLLRVWQGPGHEAGKVYEMRNVLCSVWAGS